jgi:hypothetical protein
VSRDLNRNSGCIFPNNAPTHDQLQGADTLQQEGPFHGELHPAVRGESVVGFKKDAAAADVRCAAGSENLNAPLFQQLIFNLQHDWIPLVLALLGAISF